ncbi:MAG: hypothetical protein QXR53_05010 [Candidatus Norongarragalinales archaeon]
MKKLIIINQRELIEQGLAFIDLVDAALLDFIHGWSSYEKSEKNEFDGKKYVWISHKLLSKQIPLAHITTYRGWFNRLKKLERFGLIEMRFQNDAEQKSWVRVTPAYERVVFSEQEKEDKSAPPMNERSYPLCTNVHTPYERTFIPPMNERSYNNTRVNELELDGLDEFKISESHRLESAAALPPDTTSGAWSGSEPVNGSCLEPLETFSACGNSQEAPSHYDFLLYEANRAREKKRRAAWSLDDVRQVLSSKDDGDALLACFDATAEAWASWLDYKRSEKKGTYKRADTFALQVERISRQCNYDSVLVRESIEQSRANGWQGIYPSKKQSAEPYSYEAKPSGAPLVENLRAELREFYARHPEAFKEITAWLDDAGFLYDKHAMSTITLEFCAFRVAGMHFSDTFAQHHAALFKRVQHVANGGAFKRKPFTKSQPTHELNPVKF